MLIKGPRRYMPVRWDDVMCTVGLAASGATPSPTLTSMQGRLNYSTYSTLLAGRCVQSTWTLPRSDNRGKGQPDSNPHHGMDNVGYCCTHHLQCRQTAASGFCPAIFARGVASP